MHSIRGQYSSLGSISVGLFLETNQTLDRLRAAEYMEIVVDWCCRFAFFQVDSASSRTVSFNQSWFDSRLFLFTELSQNSLTNISAKLIKKSVVVQSKHYAIKRKKTNRAHHSLAPSPLSSFDSFCKQLWTHIRSD